MANKAVALEEMLNYPIISFSKTSSSRKFLHQIFQRKGLYVKPDVEVGSVELLIKFEKIGMGIAFVTKELVLREENYPRVSYLWYISECKYFRG